MTSFNIRSGDIPILIRKTAEEIAGVFYDKDRSERFRKNAGTQDQFVRQCWRDHVGVAVDLLTTMLEMPGTDEKQKEAIYDAITELNEKSSRRMPPMSTRMLQ